MHPTSQAAEIAKFEAIAHRFWDPEGEFKPLHVLNPTRVNYITERVALADARLLDAGCGGGLLAEALARQGAKVTAIDLSTGMIDVAKLHAEASGLAIDYRLTDLASLAAMQADAFDVVTCMEMIEHVPEPAEILRQIATLVRPGGDVFLSTLNRNLRSFLVAIVGAEYLTRLVPAGTHDYERLIKPSELARWARASGLELVDIAGVEYNPLTSESRLTVDPSVNYLVHLRRL
jgi:2-polyprenyl-6-hydroxyphenyl methylase/3-demethylubiquinone-9 3-methyltransferase